VKKGNLLQHPFSLVRTATEAAAEVAAQTSWATFTRNQARSAAHTKEGGDLRGKPRFLPQVALFASVSRAMARNAKKQTMANFLAP
jgi:hypothetical protein